ncbi:MAG: OmpA family protein [Proteobacteria bacterium]|nr:OmpA family protein [Pseudomonadota bacterium]
MLATFALLIHQAFQSVAGAATLPVVPIPAALPAQRSYLIFFRPDSPVLSRRAQTVIADVAAASKRGSYTRIAVSGYADTAEGSSQQKQAISLRRAQAVGAALAAAGVPRTSITAQGFADSKLAVPTGPGVHEQQNRRVEIVME